MSSSAQLYGAQPPASDGGNTLDSVPLKLDMTDPKNQRQAAAAWNAYRSLIGKPVPVPQSLGDISPNGQKVFQAAMNVTRMGDALKDKFAGWPDDAIFNEITAEQGLAPGQAKLGTNAPPGVLSDVGKKISGVAMAPKGQGGSILSWNGKDPQTLVYVDGGESPYKRLGIMAHEAVHAGDHAFSPSFKANPAQANLDAANGLGEEAAPHFANGWHDRRIVDALAADQLATRYGGYPGDVKPQSPWPVRPRVGGSKAPSPELYNALIRGEQ